RGGRDDERLARHRADRGPGAQRRARRRRLQLRAVGPARAGRRRLPRRARRRGEAVNLAGLRRDPAGRHAPQRGGVVEEPPRRLRAAQAKRGLASGTARINSPRRPTRTTGAGYVQPCTAGTGETWQGLGMNSWRIARAALLAIVV